MTDAPGNSRKLTVEDHSRDAANLRYVYPVVSRRARGVSVGINLNPNNACNWACVYCQVPDLVRGAAPQIDLDLLVEELTGFLDEVAGPVTGPEWMEQHAPPEARRLNDIAFSGNGEPTTVADFEAVVAEVLRIRDGYEALTPTKTVLITNGSRIHAGHVQRGLERMASANGEVWFKLDSATPAGRASINGSTAPLERVLQNLRTSAETCRTLIQTCAFGRNSAAPTDAETAAYLDLLTSEVERGTPIAGVLLYGLARPSLQPAAPELFRLEDGWIQSFAERIRGATGLPVEAHA
ncbi:MAG: radical SAM protein [Planctomycetota bacterium]